MTSNNIEISGLQKIKNFLHGDSAFWFYLFRIIPIKNNKIVCSNFMGKGYGDNPKYICEEIIKKYDNKSVKIIWLVNEYDKYMPSYIKQVKRNSIRASYELATSKIWIDNHRKSLSARKRKKQFYIQTWHAGIPGKRVEGDAVIPLPELWIEKSKHDSDLADLFISNSKFCTEHYKRAFWYDGEIIECGSPRNDILFDDYVFDNKKLRKKLGIKENLKLVLYAPTFRMYEENVYDIDMEMILRTLTQKFGGEWGLLLRMHPRN